jgi:hypothetical protein
VCDLPGVGDGVPFQTAAGSLFVLPLPNAGELGKRIGDTSCGPGPTGTHPRHWPQLRGLTGDDLPWLEDAIVANLAQAAAPRLPVVALTAPADGYPSTNGSYTSAALPRHPAHTVPGVPLEPSVNRVPQLSGSRR